MSASREVWVKNVIACVTGAAARKSDLNLAIPTGYVEIVGKFNKALIGSGKQFIHAISPFLMINQ